MTTHPSIPELSSLTIRMLKEIPKEFKKNNTGDGYRRIIDAIFVELQRRQSVPETFVG